MPEPKDVRSEAFEVPRAPENAPPGQEFPAGNVPSLEEVVRDHAPRVYNLARRMLNNDDDAEDVTQEVFLRVVQKLPEFRGESDITTWLHRITVNVALYHRQRRAAQNENRVHDPLETVLEDKVPSGPSRQWSAGPEEVLQDREAQALIEQAIADLPEVYRDVFVLADVEGLPNQEISDLLGLSLSAVKSRLHRARLMLRNALAPHFEEVAT